MEAGREMFPVGLAVIEELWKAGKHVVGGPYG